MHPDEGKGMLQTRAVSLFGWIYQGSGRQQHLPFAHKQAADDDGSAMLCPYCSMQELLLSTQAAHLRSAA